MRYFKRLILLTYLPLPLLANYQLFADSVDKTSNILIVHESKKHETFLNSGRQKLKDNDYLGAIKDFTQAIEIDSKDWRSYHNRAISKWELEDYKGAISDYSKAIDLNSQPWSLSFIGRAINKQQIGNIEGAISDYSMAIDLALSTVNRSMAYYQRAILKVRYVLSAN